MIILLYDIYNDFTAKADATALDGLATTTALSEGLAAKADATALDGLATTTALSEGLAAKADIAAIEQLSYIFCAPSLGSNRSPVPGMAAVI
eukprot:scaffold17478_cov142-Isochrysis_galbana.AAC.2